MLSFITYKNHPEQIEIVGDENGLQELIYHLNEVKRSKDHIHLIIGSEIDEFPIPEVRKSILGSAKAVRIEYSKSEDWQKKIE